MDAPEGEGGVRTEPGPIEGDLAAFSAIPDRAAGIDLRTARGPLWSELLGRADGNKERLRTIQVIRGCKPGWIYYIQLHHRPAEAL